MSLSLPMLRPAGSIEAYVAAVRAIPALTREQELSLARRVRDTGDREAAREVIHGNLRHVVAMARGYLGYGLPFADLVQEGTIGLLKALRKFDPEKGFRLITFAGHWIRAEINEYVIANWSLVKVASSRAQRKLFFRLRSLKGHANWLGRAEMHAIARQLDVDPADVAHMDRRLHGSDLSLDAPAFADDEDSPGRVHQLAAPDDVARAVEHEDEDRTLRARLRRALPLLDERSRDIIERRWLAPDGQGSRLCELARDHGVSVERIRQIQQSALRRLRDSLQQPEMEKAA